MMEFKLEQINQAHSKVKSGVGFPRFIQELILIGVIRYETRVEDGKTNYFGKEDYSVSSSSKFDQLQISENPSVTEFTKRLKAHQNGESDFLTFCTDCAKNGVQKWVCDLMNLTCTYFDVNEGEVLTERIVLEVGN
jgi:uncharacterized protein YbcV (DUF1398 family)